LQRAAADGDAAPARLWRQRALLGRVEFLNASVAAAIEHRDPARPESSEEWQRALGQARVALDEIAASLEPAANP
jgi:hypothetical protein